MDLFFFSAPPVIRTPLAVVEGVIGESLTLTCTSEGSPPDTFTWMKDGVPIHYNIRNISESHTKTEVKFKSTYTISSFSADDAGNYTCNVTNPIGSASENITVGK